MHTIARVLVAVGIVGCSTAAHDRGIAVPIESEVPGRTWAAAGRASFAASSPALGFEWLDGRISLVQREVRPGPRAHRGAAADAQRPIGIQTAALGRESALVSAIGNASRRPDGTLVVDRGIAVERLEQRRAGLAQSWKFGQKPAGAGDLIVRLSLSGVDRATADARGVVLTAGARNYRYGTATWIDATGATRQVAVDVVDGNIEVRVPSALVDASTFPATLDPIVSAEAYGPPRAATPRVAGAGASYVAVWQDYSTSPPRIVSARVDASTGQIQKPFAVPVSAASANVVSQPAIARSGSGYFVAYHDEGSPNAIRGRFLDGSGAPVGEDLLIGGTSDAVSWPAVSCGDMRCLVAWQQFANGVPQVHAAFVTQATSEVGAEMALTSSTNAQSIPDVATDGTRFLATWSETRDDGDAIVATVLADTTGTIVDVEATPTWYRSSPRAAYASGSFFVTYADARNVTSIDVFAKRLSATSGAPVDEAALTVAAADGDEDYPIIASDGTNAIVVYADADVVHSAALGPTGALVGSATLDVQPYAMPESIAASASNLLATWSGTTGAYANQLYAARVRADGASLDTTPIALSAGPGSCSDVTIAASPTTASAAGAPVTFTASSTCVDATPEFQFWLETPGIGFQLLRDFSAAPSATWTTTDLATDAYRVVVRARRAGLFSDWESEAEVYHGIVGAHGTCSQLSATASADTVASGAAVDVDAAATCTASESPEYQYAIALENGVNWIVRDWGTAPFTWDTTGFPTSNPSLVVRTRRAGSSAAFDAETRIGMLVANGPGMCPIASLTPSASVVTGGDSVALTASASCANDETAEYEFVVRPPSGSTRVFRAYGPSPTATFTADGVSGVHHFWVRTRRAGSALPLEGRAGTTVYVQ